MFIATLIGISQKNLGAFCLNSTFSLAQQQLIQGEEIQKKVIKNEKHLYILSLKKGEPADVVVMQKEVDLAIDVNDPSGNKISTFDSPNGKNDPEPVKIEDKQTGKYQIYIHPFTRRDTSKSSENIQGDYAIQDIHKISAQQCKAIPEKAEQDKLQFSQWLKLNAYPIETVNAGSGFENLQQLKTILKNVQVVGLGEASHGTSEFFRMKHRMLEFLVKEMGFTLLYIEASMARCRYINDYVINGHGSFDTATAIQGFWVWRVEEMRDMIEWIRKYNSSK